MADSIRIAESRIALSSLAKRIVKKPPNRLALCQPRVLIESRRLVIPDLGNMLTFLSLFSQSVSQAQPKMRQAHPFRWSVRGRLAWQKFWWSP